MVRKGSILVQNNTKYENGQHSPRQFGQIILYSNIFEYFGQIYSFAIYLDIHSWSFYHAKYIRIFIHPISMVTNILQYSFIKKEKDICPTLNRKINSNCMVANKIDQIKSCTWHLQLSFILYVWMIYMLNIIHSVNACL